MIIRGIFTDEKLSPEFRDSSTSTPFIVNNVKGIKNGDMLTLKDYDTPFQVLYVFKDSEHKDNYLEATVLSINNKQINHMETFSNKKNSMFSGLMTKWTSQFVPQKEANARMSMGGTLCVLTDKDSDEWTGIDKNGDLTVYPGAMTIDLGCIYSISKPNNSVQVGDIIKNGERSYAYVQEIKPDGTLKIQSFSGYTHNKKAIKDALMGQATTKVIINPFNFNEDCGFNPLMFAIANGESMDVESLMLLSATPQGKNLFSNTGGGFNMGLLWMLDRNKQQNGGGSDMMQMMMMTQMMGGNNPFSSMFQQPTVTPEVKKEEPKVDALEKKLDKLADIMSAFVNAQQNTNKD